MWRLRRVQPSTTTEAETRGAKQVSLRTVENRKPPGSSVPNIPEPLLIRCIDLWSINSLNQILREYGSHPETKINAAKFPGTWTDSNFPPHQIIAMIRLLSCLRRTNTFINMWRFVGQDIPAALKYFVIMGFFLSHSWPLWKKMQLLWFKYCNFEKKGSTSGGLLPSHGGQNKSHRRQNDDWCLFLRARLETEPSRVN